MGQRFILSCGLAFSVVATAVADDQRAATPIKYLIIIFQENASYDHYFGTYPMAKNNPGETPFKAKQETPRNNNLLTPLDVNNGFKPFTGIDLIHNNPNSNPNAPIAPNSSKKNGAGATNPFRLSAAQAVMNDQGHNYTSEEEAYNNFHMDGFPARTGVTVPLPIAHPATVATKGPEMGYYDGNTTTALWNYAQYFAMSDNSFTTTFGPSTPGALNLIAGQNSGFSAFNSEVPSSHETSDGGGSFTMIGEGDPLLDVCSSSGKDEATVAGPNIGDLLNARGITWGWFEGGFDLTIINPNGTKGCGRSHAATQPPFPVSPDYIPHHQPFQYFASTRNPTHSRPSSVAAIGHSMIPSTKTPDPANHQYDIHDFFDALNAGQLPAVSYLKAPAYQDGHAGYSDPLDEQIFIVQVINTLQKTGFWSSTAVIIAYGDSDGMYDHQMPPIVNPSFSVADKLNGSNTCNHGLQQGRATPVTPLNGAFGYPAQGRCGYGTRVPLVVVSPFAKENFVDHTLTDQSSILRFIEDNWLAGQRVQPNGSFDTIAGPLNNLFDFEDLGGAPRKLFLDETTGAVSPANVGKGQRNARQVSPQQVSPQELSAVALSASSCPYLVDSNGTTLVDNNGRPITAC